MAWNPEKGFYISPVMLDAPWDDEVKNITTVVGEHNNKKTLSDRKFDEKITFLSFKSKDGRPETKPAVKGHGEIPDEYHWTPLYFNNPVLKSTIDWFKAEKTRVRIARTIPGAYINPHYDWDNLLHHYDNDNIIVRVWLPLDNIPVWYRFTNGIDDVSVRLQRGQFVLLNVDTVIHATHNVSNVPRSNLIIHLKCNQWIRCLPDLFPQHRIINPLTDDSQ